MQDEQRSVADKQRNAIREIGEFQKNYRQQRRRTKVWNKYFETVDWASKPKSQFKSQVVPGHRFEQLLVVQAVIFGLAYMFT